MPKKTQDRAKLLLLALLFVGGLVAMAVFATQQTASTVFTPTEILATLKENPADIYRVRVAGRVSSDQVDYQVQPTFKLSFSVHDRPANGEPETAVDPTAPKLRVVYEDVKPDMFTNGRDVLIDGDIRGGVLSASSLLTQCPSKYEPKEKPE